MNHSPLNPAPEAPARQLEPPRPPPPPNPPATTPPPPPPRRGGFFLRGCFTLFLLCIGIGVLLAGWALYRMGRDFSEISAKGEGGHRFVEEPISGPSHAARKIVVIDIKGLIVSGGGSYPRGIASAAAICRQLDAARKNKQVAAVLLDMNTPGGEVTASDEIHHSVVQFRQTGRPVVVCMHGLGASGGYYVACAANYILANPQTLTGSIGVIMDTINYAELFRKIGLKAEVFKSGKMKDMLNGARAPTPEEKAYVQSLIDETFQRFARMVAQGRGFPFADAVRRAPFGDGRVLSARDALRYHLIDGLGYFQDAVAKAKELAHAPGARVVKFKRPPSVIDLLLSSRARVHAPLAGLFPEEYRWIKPGCLYYLMPAYLPGTP